VRRAVQTEKNDLAEVDLAPDNAGQTEQASTEQASEPGSGTTTVVSPLEIRVLPLKVAFAGVDGLIAR